MSKQRSNPQKDERESESKFDALTGGKMQGRAGESLSSHEETFVGSSEDWEHEDVNKSHRKPRSEKIMEMEYERGPGSKFEIEGRGSKRRKSRNQKGGEE